MIFSRQQLLSCVSVLLLLLSTSQFIQAQVPPPPGTTFEFEWFQVGGSSPISGSFTAAQGSTISFEAWIRETSNTNILSNTGANGYGLFSTGVRANYGTPSILSIATPSTDIVPNAQFNDVPILSTTTGYAQFTASRDLGESEGVLPDINKRIYLGTFTFTASGAGGTSTTITLMDIPTPSEDTFTFANDFFLDDHISNSNELTVNISAVPEPSSIFAMLAGVMILLFIAQKHSQLAMACKASL